MDSDEVAPSALRRRTHRGQLPWRKDGVILARLREVERLHLRGKSNVFIAKQFGVDEGTIRSDLKRIQELWLERSGQDVSAMRAQAAAELDAVRVMAIEAAEFDERCERAVLFNEPFVEEDGTARRVYHDDKGSARFSGGKAASLNVARQATMDRAKIFGLVVEKTEHDATSNFLETLRELGKRHD